MSKRQGKKPQRFTQRELERAQRAAPDRSIRICRDGTLELLPTAEKKADVADVKNPFKDEAERLRKLRSESEE